MIIDKTVCTHPADRQLYKQLNSEPHPRITVADLLGGVNPYVWRVEYCAACGQIMKTFGDVPEEELRC
jgi:hypothetical protein